MRLLSSLLLSSVAAENEAYHSRCVPAKARQWRGNRTGIKISACFLEYDMQYFM
jgi:hypothetical protein